MVIKSLVICVGLVALAATGSNATPELTNDNFETETAGKSAFVKFFAPWCGHCKSMKPAWDKLSDKYADNKNIIIADVDCTQEKDLCGKFGVSGYPTIKYFTTATGEMGEKFEGGRDYAALEKFASESLGPSCGPGLEDLCSEDQLALLNEAKALSADELDAAIAEKKAAIEGYDENFKAEVEKLQATYQTLMDEKDAKTAADSPSLSMYQAVKAGPAATEEEAKEEL